MNILLIIYIINNKSKSHFFSLLQVLKILRFSKKKYETINVYIECENDSIIMNTPNSTSVYENGNGFCNYTKNGIDIVNHEGIKHVKFTNEEVEPKIKPDVKTFICKIKENDIEGAREMLIEGLSPNQRIMAKGKTKEIFDMKDDNNFGNALYPNDDKYEINLFIYLIVYGNLEFVKMMIEFGADINYISPTGIIPLTNAALVFKYDVIKLLVDSGVRVNFDDKTKVRVFNS